jgi:hypothetical protein
MPQFIAAIPIKFRREQHPLGVGPDDLIAIDASTYADAYRQLRDTLGRLDAWCSIYGPADLPDTERSKYYPGRIVPLTAT